MSNNTDSVGQKKINLPHEALYPFLQNETFINKYGEKINLQKTTALLTKDQTNAFLTAWIRKNTTMKADAFPAMEENSWTESLERSLVLINNNICLKVAVFCLKNASNRKYSIRFYQNDFCIHCFSRKCNCIDSDLFKKRVYSTRPDNILLFAYIIFYLSFELNICNYLDISLTWATPEGIHESLVKIEAKLYEMLSVKSWSSIYQNSTTKKPHVDSLNTLTPQLLAQFGFSSNTFDPIVKYNTKEKKREVSDEWTFVYLNNSRDYIKKNPRDTSISKITEIKKRVLDEVTHRIVSTAESFPLLSSMMQTEPTDYTRIRNIVHLLQQISLIQLTIESKDCITAEVTITPLIQSTLQLFEEQYAFLQTKYRNYTQYDVFLFLSLLADKLSQNTDHTFTADEMKAFLSWYAEKSGSSPAFVNEIFEDLKNHKTFISSDINFSYYKFKHKQLRLVFWGISKALQANSSADSINASKVLALTPEKQNRKNHIQWTFDAAAIFTTALLNTLTYENRQNVLDGLCTIASNGNSAIRALQEKAIAILSYYLCEANQLTGKYRDLIFEACYRKDLYKIQETLWQYIRQNSPYYLEKVKRSWNDACKFDETQKYSLTSPDYIYLWWDLKNNTKNADERFLKKACILQHQSWYGFNVNNPLSIDDILQRIDKAIQKLNDDANRSVALYYIYSLNQLLLALSNIRIQTSALNDNYYLMYNRLCNKLESPGTADRLIRAILLCDFKTRQTNREYDTDDPYAKKNLFILSGAVRFICSFQLNTSQPVELASLHKDMPAAYQKWYARETGRWKVLLTRLLSYTDFFTSPLYEIITPDLYSSIPFLKYDNTPPSYSDFIESPRKLYF